MSPDKLFVLMWFLGAVFVAILMEFVKLSKGSKARWRIISALLVASTTLSAWFGVDGHDGNAWLLFIWVLGAWVVQLIFDLYGAKKLMLKIVNMYLKKHGYAQLEVQ